MGPGLGNNVEGKGENVGQAIRDAGADADASAAVAPGPDVPAQPTTPRRYVDVAWTVAIILVAFIARYRTAGHYAAGDEPNWLARSYTFSEALRHRHFSAATIPGTRQATMPGVTTMWAGTLARVWWGVAHLFGAPAQHGLSTGLLRVAQVNVAITCALLIGVIMMLAVRWAGRVTAYTAGVLLATEPFVVAHGAVLHTDELTAFFGAAGVLALLLLLDLPRREARVERSQRSRRGLMVTAGALLGLAALTKVSALDLVPGLVVLVAYAVWHSARTSDRSVRTDLLAVGAVLGVALVTFFVLWPALWTDAWGQLVRLRHSMNIAEESHVTYFRGRDVTTPGPTFYAFAFPLRMTPWFFISLPIGTVLALVSRAQRAKAVCLIVVTIPIVAIASFASQQFDRYSVWFIPFCALLVGLGLQHVVDIARGRVNTKALVGTGVAAALGCSLYTMSVAPWGLAYYNPMLGGGQRAVKTLLVGWGEGIERMHNVVREREHGNCDRVVVIVPNPIQTEYSCGVLVSSSSKEAATADYAITYISDTQRLHKAQLARLDTALNGMRPIYTLRIRGITYGVLYARH
jgi:hypothetical protein